MTSPTHRVHLPTFLAIVVVAAIFRAGIAAPEACISRDGVWFVEMARKLADDPVRHMQIETKQPGLSWVLLATHTAIGGVDTPESWQSTGKLIAGIGGVAVCALVYFLALRLFGPTVATVAGVFAAFWPQGAQLSADVLSDMPHLAIYLSTMALLAAGPEKHALLRWPIAGLVIGVAYWFRLEAIGLLPAVVIWTFVTLPKEHRGRAIAPVVLFLLAFASVAGPFVVLARWPAAPATVSTPRASLLSSSAVVSGLLDGHCPVGSVTVRRRRSTSRATPPGDSAAPSGRNQGAYALSTGFVPTASRSSLHPWLRSGAPSERKMTASRAPRSSSTASMADARVPCRRLRSACRARRPSGSEAVSRTYARDRSLTSFEASLAAYAGGALPLANAVAPANLPGRMAEEWARSGRYVFAALFLAGLFIKSTPRGARPLALLCGLVAVFQLLLVAARVLKYGELSSRYMLVPIALTIPWAAAAFVHLVRLAVLRSTDTSRYKYIPIWATGLMLALFPMIYYAIRPINDGRQALRAAGCWLRDAVVKEDVILADDQNLSQVQYYADRIYPVASRWQQIERDAGEAARLESIRRIRPPWFVTMIDKPDEPVDADARAAALCEALPGYVLARVLENDTRPVIVLRRGPE